MRLRSKVLLAVVAVMAINYLVIGTGLVLLRARQAVAEQRRQESQVGALFLGLLDARSADPGQGAAENILLLQLGRRLVEAGFLGARWRLIDIDGEVITASEDALPSAAARVPLARQIPLVTADGRCYSLESDPPSNSRLADFWDGAGTLGPLMLAGTVLLAAVVFMLLSHWVLDPVEQLLGATRRLGETGQVRSGYGSARRDEVGELLRAFDRMASEVMEARSNLEARVAEATAEIAATQRSLALQERLAATGRLAAGIAHEINNPLGGVRNALERLKRDDLTAAKRDQYHALAVEGLERMRDIVRHVLEFARHQPAIGPVDPAGPLRKALAFCAHRFEAEGVRCQDSVPATLPPVTADAGELQQVYLNVLQNALDAMAEDGKESFLRLQADLDAQTISITIADSGVGMTPEECSASVDLFHTTKPVGQGTGLGLSLAHDMVTRSGGTLALASAKGAGTAVTVTLPRCDGPAEERKENHAGPVGG